MESFKRIFKYVWPQWHRLVVIVVSAMMIGILFAFSIGTVLPLLKVMMGEEGLHGWIDRLIAKNRYGVSFYVPDKIDMSDPNVVYHLRVTDVKEESQAAIAGLEALKFPCSVTLYSDSRYLVDAMTKGWAHRWGTNNWWRNKREKAVNVDLWERLLYLCHRHTVKFAWIKGHEGNRWNEKCDVLSRKAANQQNLPVDEGYE